MHSRKERSLHAAAWIVAAAALMTGCGGGGDSPSGERCFDDAIYAPGAIVKTSYRQSWGDAVGTYVQTDTVRPASVTFNGQSGLTERTTRIDGQIQHNGSQSIEFANTASYLRVLASSVALHGSVSFPGRSGFPTVTRTYEPVRADERARLRVGEELWLRETGTQVSSGGFAYPVPSAPEPFTVDKRVRFDAVEMVGTPAGQYLTCKYRVTENQAVRTEWLYRGVVIRRENTMANGETRVFELQSASLNDAPL